MKSVYSTFVALAAISLCANAYSSTTYPGQDCEARTGKLKYEAYGARNPGTAKINISCPLVRHNDGGSAPATSVVYFANDGKAKTCIFDNFNIDTGAAWGWTAATGVTRLVLPTLTPTKPWSPFVLNCTLPAGSKVTGYYLSE